MNELALKYALVDVVQSSGITLSREGNVWVGNCPFHDDDNGALLIEPSTQHWQCDGHCQSGGTLIEWLMTLHNISRDDAMAMIQTGHGIKCQPCLNNGPSTLTFSSNHEDEKLNHKIVDYYHHALQNKTTALAYLQGRKIDNSDALDHFKLGFSDRTLGNLLPQKNRKEGAAIRGRLQQLGWVKASGHELMRGSLVVPVLNDEQVIQAYGRKITASLRVGTPEHVYLHETFNGVFNYKALTVSDEWLVCQSFIDALTFWCAGYRNVTCTYGLTQWGDDFLNTLKNYRPKRVLIAYEATQRGEQAAQKLSQAILVHDVEAYRIELAAGQDVNEYALNYSNTAQALGEVIRKAVWIGKQSDRTRVELEVEVIPEAPSTVDLGEDELPIVTESLPEEESLAIGSEPKQEQLSPQIRAENIPATVAPKPPEKIEFTRNDLELSFHFDKRRYRVRGLENNKAYDQLRINLLVAQGDVIHVDSFDLYSTKHRHGFIKLAALELGIKEDILKKDLAKLLLQLEIHQHDFVNREIGAKPNKPKELNDKDREQAMAILTSHSLIDSILDDYSQCGLVGEDNNKLLAYLATLSRKLDNPLAVMVQSTSAAGKSALMDHVLAFVPKEDRVQYSALTGQSLFYMDDINLKHKILAISENEGVNQAAYALRLLQSEGHLTIATTGKDPSSGKHTTHEYKVEGPVTIFSTTAAVNIDEELFNRCLVLHVDEEQEQTKAIHDWQRFEQTLAGMQALKQRQGIIKKQQNIQRLIRPITVVNPYAEKLTFTDLKTRTRRDHPKYLTLIRIIALLHQHQRELKTTYIGDEQVSYIEVMLSDIELANRLIHDVVDQSFLDLPMQTQTLLGLVDEMVTSRCKSGGLKRNKILFTRRDIRDYSGWGMTQVGIHLSRLESMEYLVRHRGKVGQQMVYALLYQKNERQSFSAKAGLIDLSQLKQAELAASSRKTKAVSSLDVSSGRNEAHGLSGGMGG